MSIQPVGNHNGYSTVKTYNATATAALNAETMTTELQDTVALGSTTETAATYKPDAEAIAKLKTQAEQPYNQLRDLVVNLLTNQGRKSETSLTSLQNKILNISRQDIEQAQADIAEDGYYGVKQTSERILDFAKALSGGDPSKITMLRNAVEKGFAAAKSAWGGKMPDITGQTYDAVMAGFDAWAAESAGE